MANQSVAQFRTAMKNIRNQVRAGVRESFLLTAEEIAANMRDAAPKGEGNLAASVRVIDNTRQTSGSSTVSVFIRGGGALTMRKSAETGRAFDYSHAIEFGTEKMQAEPFFYPTWRRYRGYATRRTAESVEEAIERNREVVASRQRPPFNTTRRQGVVTGKQRQR